MVMASSPLPAAAWRPNSSPTKPGTVGKQSEPSTPLAFMSSMRASTSKQPRRSCESAVGSIPYSSGRRPATAFSPTFGICCPSNTQTSLPSCLWTSRGARSFHFASRWRSHMSGGSQTWSSTLTRIMSFICMATPPSAARQPEDALRDDVALDLGGARRDRGGVAHQVLLHPRLGSARLVEAPAGEIHVERIDAERLGRQPRGALGDLGAEELEHGVLGRCLAAGELREAPVAHEPHGLSVDVEARQRVAEPLALADPAAVGPRLARQLEQALEQAVEPPGGRQ